MKVSIGNNIYVLSSTNEIKEGNEATIHELNSNTLAKLYKKEQNYEDKILALIDKFNNSCYEKLNQIVSIPIELAYNTNSAEFKGFTMKFFKAKDFIDCCYNLPEKKYEVLSLNDGIIHKLIINLFNTVKALHTERIIIGDVNDNNLLIDLINHQIIIVDIDSAQFDDYESQMAKEEWCDWRVFKSTNANLENKTNFSIDTDLFALTVGMCELIIGISPFEIGITPVIDTMEKKMMGLSFFNFLNKDIVNIDYKGVKHKFKVNQNEIKPIRLRISELRSKFPALITFFENSFIKKKRKYYMVDKFKKTNKETTKKSIRGIRTVYKNFDVKTKDPPELEMFLKTYGLKK